MSLTEKTDRAAQLDQFANVRGKHHLCRIYGSGIRLLRHSLHSCINCSVLRIIFKNALHWQDIQSNRLIMHIRIIFCGFCKKWFLQLP